MSFIIKTSGTAPDIGFGVGSVVLTDLANRVIIHPTNSFDLEWEFSKSNIASSTSLHEALENGWLTARDEYGGYEEISYTGNKVTSVVGWTDSSKTQKVFEQFYSYTGNNITAVEHKTYNIDGSLYKTLTEINQYSQQGKIISITRNCTCQ